MSGSNSNIRVKDREGLGPTHQRLSFERERKLEMDVQNLPEDYKRHPNVSLALWVLIRPFANG